MPAVPPNQSSHARFVPLLLAGAALFIGSASAQTKTTPDPTRQERPVVTEVPSAQLPEKYRNQPKPFLPEPPSMRYEQLREHLPPRIVLPTLDTTPYKDEDAKARKNGELKVRGGVMRPVNITPEKDGEWSEPEPGVRVWRVEIQSPGAEGVRLHISNLRLTSPARLFVYDPVHVKDTEVLYQSHAEWYSLPTTGDTIAIELQSTPSSDDTLKVAAVGHVYRNIVKPETSSIDPPGTCNLDAACYPDQLHVGNSVARISYVSGDFIFYCSGAMLNNNTGDFSPIFLTAHHCGVDAATSQSLATLFFFRKLACDPNASIGGTQVNGGRLLGDSQLSDATLLEITGSVPRNATWAGWNRALPAVGSPVFSIHHPQTSFQRISFGSTVLSDANLPVPQGASPADFHGVEWNMGTVEPGSSGGPLFNQSQEVIGQLWGGLASCSNQGGLTSYGRLSSSFPAFVNGQGANYLEIGLGDDALFPNNTRNTATALSGPVTINDLVVRLGIDDWFKTTVPAGQQLGVTATAGDGTTVATELFRSDETVPSLSGSSGVEGRLLNASGSDQDFFVHVFLPTDTGGTRARYSLTTQLYSPTAPDFVNIGVYPSTYAQVDVQVYFNSPFSWRFLVQYTKDPTFATFQQTETRASDDPNFTMNRGPVFTFTDLDPGTTYYFRPVIWNSAGTLTGNPQAGTIPPFLAPQVIAPLDGATGVIAQPTLNWQPDRTAVPYDIYFGTTPDPPFVTTTTSFGVFQPFAWNQHANYGTQYYWRVAHTYRGVTLSSPVQSFTTESGPQFGFSANPLTISGLIFSSPASVLTITNTGTVWYRLTFSLSSGFGLQNNCVIPSAPNFGGLNPGQACSVVVSANHPSVGTSTGSLMVSAFNILSDQPLSTVTVTLQVQIADLVLSVPRPSRPRRGGASSNVVVSPGQTAAYHVTLTPSAPVNSTAAMACSGMPAGMSCQVRPAMVDLSGGPRDVAVTVSVKKRAARVMSVGGERASRLRGNSADSNAMTTREINLNVTATVGSTVRNVVIPVTAEQ